MLQIQDFTDKTKAQYFVHIMDAPSKIKYTSQLPFDFEYECNGVVRKAQVIDVLKLALTQITDFDSYLSHGIDGFAFRKKYMQENNANKLSIVGLYLIKNV